MSQNLKGKDLFDGSYLFPKGEFDKSTGRTDYLKKRSNVIQESFFYDNSKNDLLEDYKRYRNCPICPSGEKNHIFTKDGFQHVLCLKCDFLYVDPILNDKAMALHYEQENEWTKVMLNNVEQETNRKMYDYTLNVLKQFRHDIVSILDVGSGTGAFVKAAAEKGFKVKGLEVNKDMIGRAQEQGIEMDNVTLSQLKEANSQFDLVTSWFVLEHVPYPGKFIEEMGAVLKADGLLFVGVPNIDALSTRLSFSDGTTFSGNSHINFFNIDSLTNLLEQKGFTLLHSETYITQLNTIKNYFRKMGLTNNSGLNKFIEELTSSKIHNLLLGNLLCCIYQKKIK